MAKVSLIAGLIVGIAMLLRAALPRKRKPSAISAALEHEDYSADDTELSGDVVAFDDSIAPGAPF